MTRVTYIEGLRRYVVVWRYYSRVSYETAIQNKDLSTVLEFFEAPKPWGPWTNVKTFNTGRLGWFAPIIGQRFQTVANFDTVKAFLYAPGFTAKSEGGVNFEKYKLNYMPITLSTRPLSHQDPGFVGGR
jgi:hypothetical protein